MQPQAPTAQEPPSHVAPEIVCVQATRPTGNPNFNGKAGLILGGLQIACGIMTFTLGIAAIGIQANLYQSGVGLWCGLLFFIPTGLCGIFAGKSKAKGWIVGYMVMSIISALGCITLLIIASTGVAKDDSTRSYECGRSWVTEPWRQCYNSATTKVSVNGALIAISTMEAILYIVSANYCCARVCYCRQNTQRRAQVVNSGYPNLGMQHQQTQVINRPQVLTNGQQVIYITNINPAPVHYPQQPSTGYPENRQDDAYDPPPPYTPEMATSVPPQVAPPPQVVPLPQVAPPPQDVPVYDNEKPPHTKPQ